MLFRNSHLLSGGAEVSPQQCEALLRSAPPRWFDITLPVDADARAWLARTLPSTAMTPALQASPAA